ncbi:MAG: type II toxin-antitoxin system HicA family toxin [Ignavibacteriota bacterium]
MTKKDKLFERIKNNPRNVRFSDLRSLLKEENFFLERITGSHHIFKRNDYIFVIPVHNDRVKTVYVKKVIELIEDLRKIKGEEL